MNHLQLPTDEHARLAALRRYNILDSEAERHFDDIAKLAAQICQTPTALITLIDEERQWFKSRIRFPIAETPRKFAFCAYTIQGEGITVIEDAANDPRFADNPYVTGPPHIRFYAGAPLTTRDGYAIGSIAVVDEVPRQLTEVQKEALQTLAGLVITGLEFRLRVALEQEAQAKSRQDAVQYSDAQKSAILQGALDAIVSMDMKGNIIEFNPAAERVFGMTRAQALGRSVNEVIIPPELRKAQKSGLSHYLRTGEARIINKRVEMIAQRADGTRFPVELAVISIGSGEQQVFTAFIRDISEAARQKNALKQSKERFELVGRATNDVIYDWNLVSNELWWSENLHPLFGYSREEAGTGIDSWTSRVHPDDVTRVVESVHQVIESGGEHWEGEYRFRRADGSYAKVWDRGYVQHGEDGQPWRMIGALMDVSAREEAEERFEQLARHINEVFWLTDVKTKRFLYLSPSYEEIWGRKVEELYNSPDSWLEMVHEEDRQRVADATYARQAAGTYNEEYRIVRDDGTIRWIRARAFPIRDSAGDVYRIAGVAADITQQKQLEEELRHSQKMEAVGQLSGGVAHDFNNILTVIQGNAAMLETEAFTQDEVNEIAKEIITAAERGSGLTRQLLLFSRKQIIRPSEVNLNEVTHSVTKMLQRIVGEHITLRTECTSELPIIRADAGMIEQVLLNLVVNSRDAMPHGGEVVIRTDVVTREAVTAEPTVAADLRFVRLTVSDNGVGIPASIRPRIFEPFFTTKEPGKGTGLGLATVYGIVKQHQGWIRVLSAPDEGTTFEIIFPAILDAEARPRDAQLHKPELEGGKHTILLVEDEVAVRTLVANQLERKGYTVLQAGSGPEAIELWQRHRGEIELLLTDLIMPGGMNGRELAAHLHGQDPSLPVVYSSGYTADLLGGADELMEGVNFLQKPYHPESLINVVRKRLASRLDSQK